MSDRDYRILFGGAELPAYQVWGKLEVAKSALEVLTRFNAERALLSTEATRTTEVDVRKRLSDIELILPTQATKDPDMSDRARALLLVMTPEEAIEVLRTEHNVGFDLNGLVQLAGTETYLESLSNEAEVFKQNAILPEQIASLWNEARRPAPGKPFWDKFAVQSLLDGGKPE